MKILGYTDSENTCDCGKQGLKGVYIVETNQGETLRLGSSCVKKNWDLTQKEFRGKINEAKEQRRKERFIFIKPFQDNFTNFQRQNPNVSKYTIDSPLHSNFMELFTTLKEARIKMNIELPLIVIK